MASSVPDSDTPDFESRTKLLIEASEANIARIESQIRDLELLRDLERGTIVQLRAAIAPVRKMPAELLAEIFRYVCVSPPFNRFGWRSVVRRVQLVSHVCAHWRQVAVTTPHLWTDVLPIKLDRTPTDAYCAGLKEWLGKSAPLTIRVHLECEDGVDAAAVLGALLTAAHRWNEAYLQLPSLSILSAIPFDGLTQLQTLTLESPDTSSQLLLAFSLAHNLTQVSLQTPHVAQVRVPWSQLTHLTVVTDSSQECLDTILQCSNLVSVDFTTPAWPGRPDVSELQPVTLGKLERLAVDINSTAGSITPFFACLTLPGLKYLDLSLNHDLEWVGPEFTQFQLRSPNIETLGIASSDLNPDDLMTILRHAPALSKLSLDACRDAFDQTIVTALSFSHQTPAQLTPRLHSLSIAEGCDLLQDDMLYDLIAARWWTDERLATFPSPPPVSRWSHIYVDRDADAPIDPELEAALEEYREQGLDVYID